MASTKVRTSYLAMSRKKDCGFSKNNGLPWKPELIQFIVLVVILCNALLAIFFRTSLKASWANFFQAMPVCTFSSTAVEPVKTAVSLVNAAMRPSRKKASAFWGGADRKATG